MKDNMIIVAISGHGYWGKGETIQEALSNLEQKSDKHRVYLRGYIKPGKELKSEELAVDDGGGIQYPAGCLSLELGCIQGSPSRLIVK